jgi:hypothetical protein
MKPGVKRPLRKYKHSWEIILKWILKWGRVWTKFCLVQDRIQGICIVNIVISLRVLWKAMNFLTRWVNVFLEKGSTTWIYSEAIEGYLMAKPLPPPQCQGLLLSGLREIQQLADGEKPWVLSSTNFFLWPQHNYFILLLCHACFRWSDSVTHFIQFVILWRLILCLYKLCCSILVHFWYFYRCLFMFKHFTSWWYL